VVPDDVVLEVDPRPRCADEVEHRFEGERAVGMVLEPVAADGSCPCGAVDGEGELVARDAVAALGDAGCRKTHPTGAPAVDGPRIARHISSGSPFSRSSRTPHAGWPWVGECSRFGYCS